VCLWPPPARTEGVRDGGVSRAGAIGQRRESQSARSMLRNGEDRWTALSEGPWSAARCALAEPGAAFCPGGLPPGGVSQRHTDQKKAGKPAACRQAGRTKGAGKPAHSRGRGPDSVELRGMHERGSLECGALRARRARRRFLSRRLAPPTAERWPATALQSPPWGGQGRERSMRGLGCRGGLRRVCAEVIDVRREVPTGVIRCVY